MRTRFMSLITLSILIPASLAVGIAAADAPPDDPSPVAAAPVDGPPAVQPGGTDPREGAAPAEAPPAPEARAQAPAEAAAPPTAAPPPVEAVVQKPFDVVLVLDNSASMRRNDPQAFMSKVVRGFATKLPSDARLGIVLFDDRADIAMPLTNVGTDGFASQTDAALGRVTYRGQHTDTPAGVERALYVLRTTGRPEAHRIAVLLTDGIVDVGSEARSLERSRWLRENLAPEAKEQDVRLFGIAFTEQADFSLLQSVAQITGGRHFRVLDPNEIEGVFDQVRGRMDEIAAAEAAVRKREADARAEARAEEARRQAERAEQAKPIIVTVPEPKEVRTEDRKTKIVHEKPIYVPQPVITPVEVPQPWIDWHTVVIAVSGLVIVAIVGLVTLRVRRRSPEEAAMPAARLRTVTDGKKAKVYKIKKAVVRIGRAKDNDIVLPYETVSAHHAVIEWRDGAFHVKDLGSTNGTQRNGQFFSDREKKEPRSMRLRHRDRIGLDGHQFEFLVAAAERVQETQIGAIAAPSGTLFRIEPAGRRSKEDAPLAGVAPASAGDPADVTGPARDEVPPTRAKGQKCLVHASCDATEICPACNRAWCEWCITEVDGKVMCRGCAEKAAVA
jgi:Mg-chelatase subunit ChlD